MLGLVSYINKDIARTLFIILLVLQTLFGIERSRYTYIYTYLRYLASFTRLFVIVCKHRCLSGLPRLRCGNRHDTFIALGLPV